jgi:hypothetical protein
MMPLTEPILIFALVLRKKQRRKQWSYILMTPMKFGVVCFFSFICFDVVGGVESCTRTTWETPEQAITVPKQVCRHKCNSQIGQELRKTWKGDDNIGRFAKGGPAQCKVIEFTLAQEEARLIAREGPEVYSLPLKQKTK